MEHSIASKSSTELILLYHEINIELTTHLLEGDSWDQQHQRITLLTEISKELTRRKIEVQHNTDMISPRKND